MFFNFITLKRLYNFKLIFLKKISDKKHFTLGDKELIGIAKFTRKGLIAESIVEIVNFLHNKFLVKLNSSKKFISPRITNRAIRLFVKINLQGIR